MTDTQTRSVAALSRDLFFGMRIRTVLQQLGYELHLCKTEQELVEHAVKCDVALVDFNMPVHWEILAPVTAGATPVIAFGSHTNVDGFRTAKAAGATRVVSNGEFSRRLPALLGQYQRNNDALRTDSVD